MAKSITKPAAIIICTGGTSGDPITMANIATEDTTQGWGVVTNLGNGFFQVGVGIDIGNGTTATVVTIQAGEAVDMTGFTPRCTASATFNIGEASNTDYGKHPAFLKYTGDWTTRRFSENGATINMNCACLYDQDTWGGTQFGTGINTTVNVFSSILSSAMNFNVFQFCVNGTVNIQSLYVYQGSVGFNGGTVTIDDLHVEDARWGIQSGYVDTVITNSLVTNYVASALTVASAWNIIMRDPKWAIVQAEISNAHATSELQYENTCNVHITDKDGENISGATVTLDSSASSDYDTEDFSVSTAADGTITEQNVLVKKWVGTSETETDYNPFRATVSKVGYKTLVMENVTVDAPIGWHLELQSEDMTTCGDRLKAEGDRWRVA